MPSSPRFPNAPYNYDAQNEAQFRTLVRQAFGDVASPLLTAAALPGGLSLFGWTHTMEFSATDNDTVAWGAGSIILRDGTTYSIDAGNTGNISAITYVFLDLAVSGTILQTTTTAANAVGANRILVAVAQDVASGKNAQFQAFGGADASELVLLTADVIAANTITANEIVANTITTSEIAANTIVAGNIAANTITAAEIAAGTITATEIAAGTITATEITAGTITGTEINATFNLSTKTLTADTGTVGGWTLGASTLSSGSITLKAGSFPHLVMGSATAYTTGNGIYLGQDSADSIYKFRVGGATAGPYIRWNGTILQIDGASVAAPAAGSSPGLLGWVHDIAFTPDATNNHNALDWGSGTITLLNGVTYSIVAGTATSIAAITYIYLDQDVSSTVLQSSTTASDATGANKILVAVAQNVASGKDLEFQVFGGQAAGSKLITADNIAANTITANEIFANTIDTAQIAAGAITATQIATGTITATQITGTTLSGIYADLGTITAGKIDVGSIEINADTERILFGSATAPLTGVGIFLGKDSADYEFRAGDPADDYIHWDGSTLTVQGNVEGRVFSQVDTDIATTNHTGTTSPTYVDQLTVPANALGTNKGVRWTLWGDSNNTSGNATLRFYLNQSLNFFTDIIPTSDAGEFKVEIELFNDGATDSQRIFSMSHTGGASGVVSLGINTTSAEDTTADMTLDLNIQLANTGDDVDVLGSYVEYI